jgi:LysR family glycine cleavage system transcriptional activator
MRSIPPLAAVRVFEAVARHRNFTRAAEELGMTQAAVSYQIKLLEARIGISLFNRSKSGAELTPAAARVAPLVAGAFDSLDSAFARLRTDTETMLTVSCPVSFTANWLAPRLGAFQAARPSLAVRLESSNLLVDFARDEVDVAIRIGGGRWPGLASHFVMRSLAAPFASPAFVERHGPFAAAGDLAGVPRISPDDDWWTIWFAASGVTLPAPTRASGIRLDSQVAEARAAMAGHGVAILTPALWQADVEQGRLVQLPGPVVDERRNYWLVYPEQKRSTPKIRAFRQWLLDEIAREAANDLSGAFVDQRA